MTARELIEYLQQHPDWDVKMYVKSEFIDIDVHISPGIETFYIVEA